jgi:hypothetical protein
MAHEIHVAFIGSPGRARPVPPVHGGRTAAGEQDRARSSAATAAKFFDESKVAHAARVQCWKQRDARNSRVGTSSPESTIAAPSADNMSFARVFDVKYGYW